MKAADLIHPFARAVHEGSVRVKTYTFGAMSYAGVARVMTETTRATIGVAVSPHLFRTAIATSAAIHGGAKPYLASALLHHTDHRVTEAHYNRASNLSVAQSFQEIIHGYIKG